MKEIAENDYNLNISRYVSTAETEAEIDLAETHQQLVDLDAEIQTARDKHDGFLAELGLPPLP
jgi:type I restriction enzyme M protein